jgi:predicted Zn finger-like uncharacterized protein
MRRGGRAASSFSSERGHPAIVFSVKEPFMAEPIPVQCPECEAKFKIKSRQSLGKLVSCPQCHEQVMMRFRNEPAESRSTNEPPAEPASAPAGAIAAWCAHCNAKLKLKSRAAIGRRIDCPKCKESFVVRTSSLSPPPADEPDDFLSRLDAIDEYEDPAEPEDDYGPPAALPPVVRKPPAKKKSRRDDWEVEEAGAGFALNLGFIGWPIGGVIGGLIGAALWAGVIYLTGYEVGYIAIGVGALTGIGVRIMAGEDDGWGPGLTALAIAILAVVAGKFFGVSLLVDHYVADAGAGGDLAAIAQVKQQIFQDSFGPLDLLWFALAAMSAFRIGSNLADDE